MRITPDATNGGSLQNPAWSPDGKRLVLTRWHKYNYPPARVLIYDLEEKTVCAAVPGSHQVTDCSQPGSTWHPTSGIIFSSDRWGDESDQICCWKPGSFTVEKLTCMPGFQGTEPSWHPTGQKFCFQRNRIDRDRGQIRIGDIYSDVTFRFGIADGDNRQPNWSQHGLVYQRFWRGDWWLHTGSRRLVKGTDATWSPDGLLLFSDENGHLAVINENTKEVHPMGDQQGYRGAPSFSPDGRQIACEAGNIEGGPEEGGDPTWIEIFSVEQ